MPYDTGRKLNLILWLLIIVLLLAIANFICQLRTQRTLYRDASFVQGGHPRPVMPEDLGPLFRETYYAELIRTLSSGVQSPQCQQALRDYYVRESSASVSRALKVIQNEGCKAF